MVGSQSGRVAVLCGVLFLSGTGALIFETLWLRLSGLAFGNSIWAAALILSSFMAGLALGNAIAASSRIRRWRPLHLYALLEVLVAFFGCTIVFGLPVLGELLRPVWQILWNYQPALLGLRFAVSFLILLVPTTAMGLTLPVLIEDPMLRQTDFGRAIGFLYGSNTLGAVAGAVLGEGYLIAAFGLRGTTLAAGLASCIAAAIALFVAKFGARYQFQRRLPGSELFLFALMLDIGCRGGFFSSALGRACIFLALGGDLVSVPAAIRRLIFDGFRRDARGCAGGNRSWGVVLASVVHRHSARRISFSRSCYCLPRFWCCCRICFFRARSFQHPSRYFDLSWWRIMLLCTALMFPVALLSGILFPSIAARCKPVWTTG